MRVTPQVKEQLKKLKDVSYGKIKNLPVGVVNVRYCDLNPHDLARACFLTTNAYYDLNKKNKFVIEIMKKTVEEIKELKTISDKMSKEQILEEIDRIILKNEVDDPTLTR